MPDGPVLEPPVTERVTCVEWTRLPLVAVRVSVVVPIAAEEDVVTFKVDDPDPDIEAGVKLAVTPEGRPLTLRATLPVNPLVGVIVAV